MLLIDGGVKRIGMLPLPPFSLVVCAESPEDVGMPRWFKVSGPEIGTRIQISWYGEETGKRTGKRLSEWARMDEIW
jgi:hypothetical protein